MLKLRTMSDQRFSRKDLKQQDDFQRGATHFVGWLVERRKTIGLVLLAGVAAVSVLAGVRAFQYRQEQNAAAALAEGLRIYAAPVIDSGGLDDAVAAALGGGESFGSESEKYEAAIAALEPVVQQHSGRPSGLVAAFYLASSLIQLERNDEAVVALETAAESNTPLIRAMSLYRLGTLLSELGRHDEALDIFDQLGETPPAGFPAEEALFAKARVQEAAGDGRAAIVTYERIADAGPASIYAQPARTRAEELAARLGVTLDAES